MISSLLSTLQKGFFCLVFLLLLSPIFAQDKAEQAKTLGREAIQKMDAGEIAASLKLLAKAQALDPENIDYPYEIAYAHYLNKDYPIAIKLLKKLIKRPTANDRVYQMLGNAYDMNQQAPKAIAAYNEGLKRFPKSGILYLERGTMEAMAERYNDALQYYEKGIEVQPTFPSNYYRAAQIYLSSSEKIWGFLYGEIFMNLEPTSARTAEISKRLYDAYTSSIQIKKGDKENEQSATINVCANILVVSDDFDTEERLKMPFCMLYGTTLTLSVALEESIDLTGLCNIRDKFVHLYYQQGHDKEYDNLLFRFQKSLKEQGHFEAYNHWVLMKGNEPAFGAWLKDHETEWEAFTNWFSDHPISLTEENYFHSSQY